MRQYTSALIVGMRRRTSAIVLATLGATLAGCSASSNPSDESPTGTAINRSHHFGPRLETGTCTTGWQRSCASHRSVATHRRQPSSV